MRLRFFIIIALAVTYSSGTFAEDKGCTLEHSVAAFKNSDFKLDKDGVGSEHIKLDANTQLTLEQTDCEYIVSTYKFSFKGKPSFVQVTGAEYRKAIELLTLLENNEQAKQKMHFSDVKKLLENYLAIVASPRLQEALYLERSEDHQTSTTVAIDGNLNFQPAQITVEIISGPF